MVVELKRPLKKGLEAIQQDRVDDGIRLFPRLLGRIDEGPAEEIRIVVHLPTLDDPDAEAHVARLPPLLLHRPVRVDVRVRNGVENANAIAEARAQRVVREHLS